MLPPIVKPVQKPEACPTPAEEWRRNAGALARYDFQIPPNDFQNPSEQNPSRAEQIPNPAERNPNSLSLFFKNLRQNRGSSGVRPE
jgi:hypothetical protein